MPPHDPRPDHPLADVERDHVPRPDAWSTADVLPPERAAADAAPPLLAARLRALSAAPDSSDVLRLSVEVALDVVDGADCADVTVDRDGTSTPLAASDDLAAAIGRLQHEVAEGPCLSAVRDGELVVAHDLARDDRWPRFGPAAVDHGIRSVTAHPLVVDDGASRRVYGALNVFGRRSDPAALDVEAGAVVAAHCSVLLHAHAMREQLQEAIVSRDLIGQAKGILMERHGVAAETAFEMLRRASMDLNVKLHEIATQVTASPLSDEG